MDVGFFKHLDDIAAVLLDLICLSFCYIPCNSRWTRWLWDQISIQQYHWIITINGKRNVWKCKL